MSAHGGGLAVETGHIGLNVSDLPRSRSFYEAVFGLETIGGSEAPDRAYAFLGSKGKLLLTLWQQSDGSFEKRRPGLHHLSFQVSSVEEVRSAETRLRQLGVRLIYDGIVPHAEGAQSGGIFFEDPDGLRLEIYSPDCPTDLDAPSGAAPSCGFF